MQVLNTKYKHRTAKYSAPKKKKNIYKVPALQPNHWKFKYSAISAPRRGTCFARHTKRMTFPVAGLPREGCTSFSVKKSRDWDTHPLVSPSPFHFRNLLLILTPAKLKTKKKKIIVTFFSNYIFYFHTRFLLGFCLLPQSTVFWNIGISSVYSLASRWMLLQALCVNRTF